MKLLEITERKNRKREKKKREKKERKIREKKVFVCEKMFPNWQTPKK